MDSATKLLAPWHAYGTPHPWQGLLTPKPWDYPVSVVIPYLNTPALLAECLRSLRMQSVPCYVLVIDTGSPDLHAEALRSEQVEVHFVRGHAWTQTFENVQVALDLGLLLCRSEYLLYLNSDVSFKHPEVLAHFLSLCGSPDVPGRSPVVGPRMQQCECVNHICTLAHAATLRRLGIYWNAQNNYSVLGHAPFQMARRPQGDTHTGFNELLARAGITPIYVGTDPTPRGFEDENLIHQGGVTRRLVYDRQE